MSEKSNDAKDVPDLARHYRPVAIRSVVAAHALIKRPAATLPPEPETTSMFSLPEGFHAQIED
ncbi:hypothetical protein QO002_000430 [Pararhizobium capsulatum DSM 1112]|uniref:Uncharacterized protein n=1 Tax=Pararhizobium capsulatum DSM 1112 TaxID=1121113 RepID=A0ABU0BN35_9HYPH|nr:hypothetical protein [Pararhizobium capsulatum]MDQ0318292.1 hypothetical protein [Pararhizobium capsulatum DSM 1112]